MGDHNRRRNSSVSAGSLRVDDLTPEKLDAFASERRASHYKWGWQPWGCSGGLKKTDPTGVANCQLRGQARYVITHDGASVTKELLLGGSPLAKLPVGTLVEVLEVRPVAVDQRLRARIKQPAGWISLLNIQTGYQWARVCEPPPQQRPAQGQSPRTAKPQPRSAHDRQSQQQGGHDRHQHQHQHQHSDVLQRCQPHPRQQQQLQQQHQHQHQNRHHHHQQLQLLQQQQQQKFDSSRKPSRCSPPQVPERQQPRPAPHWMQEQRRKAQPSQPRVPTNHKIQETPPRRTMNPVVLAGVDAVVPPLAKRVKASAQQPPQSQVSKHLNQKSTQPPPNLPVAQPAHGSKQPPRRQAEQRPTTEERQRVQPNGPRSNLGTASVQVLPEFKAISQELERTRGEVVSLRHSIGPVLETLRQFGSQTACVRASDNVEVIHRTACERAAADVELAQRRHVLEIAVRHQEERLDAVRRVAEAVTEGLRSAKAIRRKRQQGQEGTAIMSQLRSVEREIDALVRAGAAVATLHASDEESA